MAGPLVENDDGGPESSGPSAPARRRLRGSTVLGLLEPVRNQGWMTQWSKSPPPKKARVRSQLSALRALCDCSSFLILDKWAHLRLSICNNAWGRSSVVERLFCK